MAPQAAMCSLEGKAERLERPNGWVNDHRLALAQCRSRPLARADLWRAD
jgi:hypothetical protein